jgi:hypothetical protein
MRKRLGGGARARGCPLYIYEGLGQLLCNWLVYGILAGWGEGGLLGGYGQGGLSSFNIGIKVPSYGP